MVNGNFPKTEKIYEVTMGASLTGGKSFSMSRALAWAWARLGPGPGLGPGPAWARALARSTKHAENSWETRRALHESPREFIGKEGGPSTYQAENTSQT